MKRKLFQITAAAFDSPSLTKLMDFAAFISPAKVKNEAAIRARDREAVAGGNFGSPIPRTPANLDGTLDRDRILLGTTLFGDVPKVTERDIQLIAEGGFDFLINGNHGEYGRQIMDWCQKYNIAVIGEECGEQIGIDWHHVEDDAPARFAALRPHPASVGDTGWDEPTCDNFHFLADYHRAYQKALPNRFLFSNLLPGMDIKAMLGTSPYADYVNRFSREVPTDYISADIYPFHPCKVMNRFEMIICLNTYHCLGNTCRRDNKDFWLYIQSQARWFAHLYTMTTYEMIKWQVYASLCYGCRSIIHASYNPVWGGDAVGMITYDGKVTEQYLYARRVNGEVQKLSPVLKDYRSLGVTLAHARRQNPHFTFAALKQKHNNRLQGFDGVPFVKSVESDSTALVGYFKNKAGQNALMLVDCRNIYDPYTTQTVTVNFAAPTRVSVYEHGEKTQEKEVSSLSLTLNACDGVFIVCHD